MEKVELGLKMARSQLEVMAKMIQNILDVRMVVNAGPFVYVTIQDGTPNCHYISRCCTCTPAHLLTCTTAHLHPRT